LSEHPARRERKIVLQTRSDQTANDPFDAYLEVPVAGGALSVARAGPPPNLAGAIVLAVHGISASHAAWRTVARELANRTHACLLAPDLRGRGRSATLPDPYGMTPHLRDLTAVLDHAGAERAVMVGHSMGAHVVARLAADHPERLAGVVLIDGGLPFLALPQDWDEEPQDDDDATAARMEAHCESPEEYVASWRAHSAFRRAWNDDVEAYVRHDMVRDGRGVRCMVRKEAVMADTFDLMFDNTTRTSIVRVRAPIRLLSAPRGPHDDDRPFVPREQLDAFATDHPHVSIEHVPETNHYTLLLGDSPGPARVAAAISSAVRDADRIHPRVQQR
jgi:pimeloyl-ACP methyl ester carboxylesterase